MEKNIKKTEIVVKYYTNLELQGDPARIGKVIESPRELGQRSNELRSLILHRVFRKKRHVVYFRRSLSLIRRLELVRLEEDVFTGDWLLGVNGKN